MYDKKLNWLVVILVFALVITNLFGVLRLRKEIQDIEQKNIEMSQLKLENSSLDNIIFELQEELNAERVNNAELIKENEQITNIINDLKGQEYELVYMGDFKITYCCDQRFDHICGGSGMTASGKPTEVGVTAASDWGVLPNGSIIYISGIGFREIQDVGGSVSGKHIDVLVQEHATAMNLGVDYEDVWMPVKKN